MKTQLCVCCALPWLYSCGSRPTVAPSGGLPQSSVLARDQGGGEGMADCPQPAGGRSPTWRCGGGGGGHTKQPEESRSEGMMLFGPHPTDRIHLSRSQCFSIVADIHIPLIFCQISLALLLLEQGMCVSMVRYNQDISSRKSRSGFPEQ